MTGEDATALFHLRCIWQDRYGINYSGGVWSAMRLHATERLIAGSAAELRDLLQQDYARWLLALRTVQR